MHRFRIILAGVFVLAAGTVLATAACARGSAAQPRSCGEATFSSNGVTYHVLFAKNGAVQQYLLARSSGNTEQDHDALKEAQNQYGPEGMNAPPLRIISFRPGPGGMMVPDKAVDSCGRVTHFH